MRTCNIISYGRPPSLLQTHASASETRTPILREELTIRARQLPRISCMLNGQPVVGKQGSAKGKASDRSRDEAEVSSQGRWTGNGNEMISPLLWPFTANVVRYRS